MRQSRAEQFMDKIDSRKRQDAAEQSNLWKEKILGKDRMLLSRAICERIRVLEKKQGASEQSNLWKGKIPGKAKILQSRKTRETRIIIAVKKLT